LSNSPSVSLLSNVVEGLPAIIGFVSLSGLLSVIDLTDETLAERVWSRERIVTSTSVRLFE